MQKSLRSSLYVPHIDCFYNKLNVNYTQDLLHHTYDSCPLCQTSFNLPNLSSTVHLTKPIVLAFSTVSQFEHCNVPAIIKGKTDVIIFILVALGEKKLLRGKVKLSLKFWPLIRLHSEIGANFVDLLIYRSYFFFFCYFNFL